MNPSNETPMAQEPSPHSGEFKTQSGTGNSADGRHSPSSEIPQASAEVLVERQTEPLKKKIEELETSVKEKENKYLYLYAEFDNFKKRNAKERADLLRFGWEGLARDLLHTVDNLERALIHIPENTDKNFIEGLNFTLKEFKSTLQKQGVQDLESMGKDFDPNFHEAVGQERSNLPAGKIIREHTRGYTLHGRLLRPARVIVSEGNKKAE